MRSSNDVPPFAKKSLRTSVQSTHSLSLRRNMRRRRVPRGKDVSESAIKIAYLATLVRQNKMRSDQDAYGRFARLFDPRLQPADGTPGYVGGSDLNCRRTRMKHRQADVFVVARDDLDVSSRAHSAFKQ